MVLSLQEYQVERDKCKLTVEEIVEADSSHGPVRCPVAHCIPFGIFKNCEGEELFIPEPKYC